MPLATEASNPKHKREVCRYWLQSKCQKGDACEFLHALMPSKMPMCPLGDACDAEECPFKHADADRPECANYQLGFCSFGRRCPHKHTELGPETLPDVSAYWSESKYAAHDYSALKQRGPNWRKKPCDYFQSNGWCPYFDMCNFQHLR